VVGSGFVGVAQTLEVGFVALFLGHVGVGGDGALRRGLNELLGTVGFHPGAAFDVGGEL
jgi:hypothetical protein